MASIKIEPGVGEAIKTQIMTSNEISSKQLVANLENESGFRLTEMAVLEIIRSTEVVNMVEFRKDENGLLIYSWKDKLMLTADSLKLSSFEKEVFKRVHAAGTSGTKSTWLKSDLGVSAKEIKRALDKLELQYQVIARTKVGKKIIYHRPDVELDESLTGGFFYDDQKPDQDAIERAREWIAKFLADRIRDAPAKSTVNGLGPITIGNRACAATVKEVTDHLNSLGVGSSRLFNETLKEYDVEQVLETMRFDDVANSYQYKGETVYYLVKNSYPEFFGFAHCPCSVCPVRTECRTGAAVNPQTCEYFTNWLNEF